MAKLLVALAALDIKYDGRRQEIAPNTVFDKSKADMSGIPSDYTREPSEQEAALYTMQNRQQQAPVSQMQQPSEPNGPGGATQERDNPDGSGSVATDADSVGATQQGKQESTGTTGAAGGTEGATQASSEKPAKAPAKKKRGEDLA